MTDPAGGERLPLYQHAIEFIAPDRLVCVGAVAGVGFTISLLITDLAFEGSLLLDAAKAGILAASVLAGVLGAVVLGAGRRARQSNPAE